MNDIEKPINGEDITMESSVESQTTQLGNYVYAERTTKEISMRGFARKAGISASYLNKIEKGHTQQPSFKTLGGLATALEVSTQDLMMLAGYYEGLPEAPTQSVFLGTLKELIMEQALTKSEAEEVADYLAFIRERRNKAKN